ncbi:MAG TPA: TIGR03936 family radical SAM-associated protein, partial [Nitrospirota bacterium]|nr:TIGR03936 family radical SAM-associated protein [Nitrospirota bacterium]
SISLPSLRVGTLTPEMCAQIKRVRKSGFTIAPEAGTQRLRDVINKNVTEDGLAQTAETVFREGWNLIKLYFMIGLPTETDEDVEGIIRLSRRVLDIGRRAGGKRKGVNVGVSAFVPKPHTPFQWAGQIPLAEIMRKKERLKSALGKKPFALKTSLAEMSVLEAAFARGGRGLGRAVFYAWEDGARFDGWTEHFDYGLWRRAFEKAGLDVEAEATRSFGLDEVLPWEHIDPGVSKAFLKRELDRALEGTLTPDCRERCSGCGLRCVPEGEARPPERGPAEAPPGGGAREKPSPGPAGRPLPNMPTARVRIRYSKLMPLALLSHAELMTMFFRAIARAGLPVAFSEGFNPHPRVSFGPALAVGVESEAEILDIELSYAIDLSTLVSGLNAALPPSVRIFEARVLKKTEPAAGVGLASFTYEAEPEVPAGGFDPALAVKQFLARDTAVILRVSDKGEKEVDIRPMVKSLEAVNRDGRKRIVFTLGEHEGKSAKPFELVQALLGLSPQDARAVRLKRVGMA